MPFPLLPNTPFAEGDAWTPELGYFALNTPVFDDQTTYLGHRERLRDDELSNVAGSIKPRVAAIESALKVSVSSGLTLGYNSGTVTLPNGQSAAISSGLVVAPNNATAYVYVAPDGSVVCDLVPTVSRILLAKVTTVAGTVTALEDLRHPSIKPIQPISAAIKVFGGSNATDYTCTNGEVLTQGVYYFRNFTVPAGVSITVNKFVKIFCSGLVDIRGSVTVSQIASGGINYLTSVSFLVLQGGQPGTGIGAGAGGGGFTGGTYPFGAQPYGSGGGLGFAAGHDAVIGIGAGGAGGGGLWIEAAGPVRVYTSGTIVANGSNGGVAYGGSVSNSNFAILSTGAGGGSGGLIYLSSLLSITCEPGSTLSVTGGNGGNGYVSASDGNAYKADGGTGGGGGVIVLSSPSNNATGANLILTGGSPGTAQATGNPATYYNVGGGAGGGFGGGGGGGGSGFSGGIGSLILRSFIPVG